jgi:catechol 2,3-dioxygenase-like lactoylglutathione lyase family enzyme
MRVAYHSQAQTKRLPGFFSLFLFLIAVAPMGANAGAVDFTRHLSLHTNGTGEAVVEQGTFFGVPGKARLIVASTSDESGAVITLNGAEIVGADRFGSAGQFEVPVTLEEHNAISVALNGVPGSSVSVRVKQVADVELHIESRLHFNTNVSNFETAREFFGKLGLGTFTGFPDTNTVEMAQAMGIETPTSYDGSKGEAAGGYLLHGELLSLSLMKWGGVALEGGMIDLIEFTIPRNYDPPYAQLNHLGIARAAMYTTDITADYDYMKSIGVEFLSSPATRSDGSTFAIFTDLDGTYFELIEKEGKEVETENTHIFRLAQLNINVSDFERSRAWYQMLGYEVSQELASTDSLEVANAMGFEHKIETRGALLTHPGDGSMLELVQWITPYNPERAYDIPANHLGIARIAFGTSDIEADVATLKSQGVQFLSGITPCCQGPDSSGGIIAFYDPDGAIIELAEQDFWAMLSMMFGWLYDMIFN